MGLFKFIYSKQSMKRKILDIKDDMIKLVKIVCNEKVWINSYGAYDIDPKYLVFWICIDTDKVKKQLRENNSLMNDLRELLVKHNYPMESRQFVKIDFESQETVQNN